KPGILLNTHRMQNLEIREEYGYFECEPGITAGKVAEALGEIGCFLPIWPGSRLVASMGGLVVNNTSGHVIDACMGKPGDYILALEVVLPSGEIIETGSKGLRRIAGTDLGKLFIGSDGILGVVTKIRMLLVPDFKQSYGMAEFEDLGDMARGVQRVFRDHLPVPIFMEMMAKDVAELGYGIKGLEPPEGSILMFAETGYSEKEASDKAKRVLEAMKEENATKTYAISDVETWHKIWGAREVIGPYLMQQDGDIISSAEVVSNLKNLVEFMDDCVNFNKGLPLVGELRNYLYGHIGALTLHPSFLIPRSWDKDRKREAVREMFQREAELNLKYDTCGGECGQFSVRTPFFIQKYGETGYGLIKGLKSMMDPNNILNPGILEGYR
ncbi:MAG: FAD-binding oxidoreductase, partial [Methanosarcinaceae archaeon]|nr:FAD-binding oxidoreductase [Methanosarcinaceae archaeon]